jgi:hypothetical protein
MAAEHRRRFRRFRITAGERGAPRRGIATDTGERPAADNRKPGRQAEKKRGRGRPNGPRLVSELLLAEVRRRHEQERRLHGQVARELVGRPRLALAAGRLCEEIAGFGRASPGGPCSKRRRADPRAAARAVTGARPAPSEGSGARPSRLPGEPTPGDSPGWGFSFLKRVRSAYTPSRQTMVAKALTGSASPARAPTKRSYSWATARLACGLRVRQPRPTTRGERARTGVEGGAK